MNQNHPLDFLKSLICRLGAIVQQAARNVDSVRWTARVALRDLEGDVGGLAAPVSGEDEVRNADPETSRIELDRRKILAQKPHFRLYPRREEIAPLPAHLLRETVARLEIVVRAFCEAPRRVRYEFQGLAAQLPAKSDHRLLDLLRGVHPFK